MRIKRITIDLDSKNMLRLIWSLSVLKFYKYKTELRTSPSGRGWHIIGWGKGHEISEHLRIRKLALDDKARIYFDANKKRTIGILFTQKETFIFKSKNELKRWVKKNKKKTF